MYIDSEGIVLRQIKAANGRRMVLLFSRKYGKISTGSSINEKGRSKAALAMRPFTFGRYELFKNRDSYNINSAETLKSFYKIGEDVDKYMCASYVLEFTDKILAEEQAEPKVFDLLIEFFTVLSERKKKFWTLAAAYMIKVMDIMGSAPVLKECASCGSHDKPAGFSVKDGGIVCEKCRNNLKNSDDRLLFNIDFGILDIIGFFIKNPITSLEKIGLDDKIEEEIRKMLKAYAEYHLDIGRLKSESFLDSI